MSNGAENNHEQVALYCVKSVRIRSFSGPNAGKNGPEKTPNTDTFHTVLGFENVHS